MMRCFLWSCLYTQGDTSLTLFFLAFTEGMCLSWICSDFSQRFIYLEETETERVGGGRGSGRESLKATLCWACSPMQGSISWPCGPRSQPELKPSQKLNQLHHPDAPVQLFKVMPNYKNLKKEAKVSNNNIFTILLLLFQVCSCFRVKH